MTGSVGSALIVWCICGFIAIISSLSYIGKHLLNNQKKTLFRARFADPRSRRWVFLLLPSLRQHGRLHRRLDEYHSLQASFFGRHRFCFRWIHDRAVLSWLRSAKWSQASRRYLRPALHQHRQRSLRQSVWKNADYFHNRETDPYRSNYHRRICVFGTRKYRKLQRPVCWHF